MLRREFRQKVGGRLPDALAQAAGRRLELPGLHLRGDRPGLGEGGFAGLHGEYRLQGRGRPIPVVGRHLREHVAHEVHHAPLVLRPGKHRVHRGDESRAPVADHEAHALQTAFDHASYELLPAGSVLPHALRHADDLAVALRVDADGDEDADVLHASAPGALVPHAVHEHVRVFGFQWPGAPSVDVVIHALELVGKGLGWHPVTPQQFADVVDLTGAHSRQVHLHQRLLDAGLPPAVAFDDRGFEDRALEFRHPELEPARLCRERAFVVAGPVRLAPLLAFVSGGPGDLVGLGVEHGVEDLGHLLGDQPVEFGLEQVLVDLYDVAVGHGCASCFPIAILCLATENRTQDAGHARFNISTKNKTESAQEFGRYHCPSVRWISLSEISENCDKSRKPIKKEKRIAGKTPYYGASGVVDHVDGFTHEGDYLLLSEDGANLLARSMPIAYQISGRNWINNHAHVLRIENANLRQLVEIYLNSISLEPYITKGAQPKLTKQRMETIVVPVPSEDDLSRIVEMLTKFYALTTSLTDGLPAEIEARRKQYEYYRDRLLSFDELAV